MGRLVKQPHLWNLGFPKWVPWLASFTGNPAAKTTVTQNGARCTVLHKGSAPLGVTDMAILLSPRIVSAQNVSAALPNLIQMEGEPELFLSSVLTSFAVHFRKLLSFYLEHLTMKSSCKWSWFDAISSAPYASLLLCSPLTHTPPGGKGGCGQAYARTGGRPAEQSCSMSAAAERNAQTRFRPCQPVSQERLLPIVHPLGLLNDFLGTDNCICEVVSEQGCKREKSQN